MNSASNAPVDTAELIDAAARERVEHATDVSLFVEAGAGTGKTRALVRRIGRLLLVDGVGIDRIAAITFTEKAAGELRDRLRQHLVAAGDQESGGTPPDHGIPASEIARRAEAALSGLDTAAIGTLHSFALRLVAENPLEAGTPPHVVTEQDTAEALAVERLWQRCAEVLFGPDRDEVTGRAADDIIAAGIGTRAFRELVAARHRDWDRLPRHPLWTGDRLPDPDITPLLSAVAGITAWREQCTDDGDKLLPRIGLVEQWGVDLAEAVADPDAHGDWIELLADPPKAGNAGSAKNWGGDAATVAAIRNEFTQLDAIGKEVLSGYWTARIQVVLDALIPQVLSAAAERRRLGTLQFHDQLVLARELLSDASVRRRVREQYQRILIDEFQDTDPLQLELAMLLTVDPGTTSGRPEDGRLFTVGDPKQSIYRFRRADISTYLRAQGTPGVEVQRLVTNFRSGPAVLDWVNRVFARVLIETDHVQPEYVPLQSPPGRGEHHDARGPAPFVFRTDEPLPEPPAGSHPVMPTEPTESELRHWCEAADVARVITTAVTEGWTHEQRDGSCRPIRYGDIAVLLPTRASLPQIEACLDAAGIEYRAEASSIVYGTPEIRDLLLTVRAAATTADSAAVVGALRSPLFACGDDDLLRWRAAGGSWAPGSPAPRGLADSPVATGLAYLSELSRGSRRPGEVLETVIRDRMVFETVAESPRRSDLWRRIRFVVEHAWAWQESASDPDRADLRDYVDWAFTLTADDARVPEAVIPELGLDAVRITTMHASKGLEYPMVVIAGMSRDVVRGDERLFWSRSGVPLVSLSTKVAQSGVAAAADEEKEHRRAERIRLLYVACTRARSRLAVSGYGWVPTKSNPHKAKTTPWGYLLGESCAEADAPPLLDFRWRDERRARHTESEGPDRLQWDERTRRVAELSAERASWSATGIVHPEESGPDPAPGATTPVPTGPEQMGPAEPDPGEVPSVTPFGPGGDRALPDRLPDRLAEALRRRADLAPVRTEELPPAPRTAPSAAGAAVGTAVHHLAEHTPLDRPLDADWHRWARDQLTALGLAEHAAPQALAEMVDIARVALEAEPVRRAADLDHWAELPLTGTLSTDDGESVRVDGVADLVVRHGDGTWSIIDYKTDVAVTCRTAEAYLLQLCAYAELLRSVTGQPVRRVELVFCRGGGATVIGRPLG